MTIKCLIIERLLLDIKITGMMKSGRRRDDKHFIPEWMDAPVTGAITREVQTAYVNYIHAMGYGCDGSQMTAFKLGDLYRDLLPLNDRWKEIRVSALESKTRCMKELLAYINDWRKRTDSVEVLYH